MSKTLNILLVEDHEADRRLVKEALADCQIQLALHELSDGEQAIKYMKKQGRYKDAQKPDLIILDLNMPRKDGHEFLEEVNSILKEDEIPVVLLTVSDNPQDIGRALNTHMHYYLSKPVNGAKLKHVLSIINELWAAA